MSSQFRFLLTYEQYVANLLRSFPEDEAMARAAGGNLERLGVLEHALLCNLGLGPGMSIVDVGCGSGRLAVELACHQDLHYLGIDVVASLLQYARRRAGREDFRFLHVDRVAVPVEDASADFVVFFAVFPHLLPEESYTYLQEAMRVLKPGGRAVFSFLEYDMERAWRTFEGNLAWVKNRSVAGHLNIFLNRQDLRIWARKLGFRVEAMQPGDRPFITVAAEQATAVVPPGAYALGQSVCILRKPAPEEAAEEEPDSAELRERRRLEREARRAARAQREGGAGGDRPQRRARPADAMQAPGTEQPRRRRRA